jgi:hypothetical protein
VSLYDRVLARPGGERALAVARLKHTILSTMHRALRTSKIESQSDLARHLRVRRSAVNQVLNGDGNLRISTLAEYLYEMGYELDVTLVKSGEPRVAALEDRAIRPAITGSSISMSSAFTVVVTTPTSVDHFHDIFSLGFGFGSAIPTGRSMMVTSWNATKMGDMIVREAMQSMAPSSQIRIDGPKGAHP